MDPLSLVRHATTSKIPVKFVDGYYIFGNYRYDKNVKTAFRRSITSIRDYRAKAKEAGVTAVVVQDTDNLRNYLTGQISTCDQIDPEAMNVQPLEVERATSSTVPQPEEVQVPQLSEEEILEHRKRIEKLHEDILRIPKAVDRITHPNKKRTLQDLFAATPLEPAFIAADKKSLQDALKSSKMSDFDPHSISGVDFSFVLNIFNDTVLKAKVAKSSKTPIKSKNPASDALKEKMSKTYGTPIIIVPNSATTSLSSLNAVDFLQNNMWISPDTKKKEGKKRTPEAVISHLMRTGKQMMNFKIVDNTTTFTESDWERVVAVFALGQEWQFKGWKWSNPVDLFHNTLGIHVMLDDQVLNANVQSWNCKVLKVHKTKRHLDAGAVNEFWTMLDEYMKLNKPWLFNQHQPQKQQKK